VKILIGDTWYPSKKAAADAVRAVLYRYPVGFSVTGDDAAFLADVLSRHPEATVKIGCGVASFQVERNLGSLGFWLTRLDGTRTDWSFLACLTPPTHKQEVTAGFRAEVRDEVQAFKTQAFDGIRIVRCPITNEAITITDAHVDHDPPFERLLSDFLTSITRTIAEITVEPTQDGATDTRLADRALGQAWAAFHRTHAGLRVVSRSANLSVLRRRWPALSLADIEAILRAQGHDQGEIDYTLSWISAARDVVLEPAPEG